MPRMSTEGCGDLVMTRRVFLRAAVGMAAWPVFAGLLSRGDGWTHYGSPMLIPLRRVTPAAVAQVGAWAG